MTASHLSDLALHRAVAGERSLTGVAEHLDACGACRARFDNVRAATAQFADDPESSARLPTLIAAINTSPHTDTVHAPRRRLAFRLRTWLSVGAMACAATAALVLAILPDGNSEVTEQTGVVGLRAKGKGQNALEIVRRNAGGTVEVLTGSAQARPGDAIRFAVRLARPGYVGVIGIDAANQVTAYAPDGARLIAMPAGGPHILDGSVVLDSTLGPERIVLLVCEAAHPIEELVHKAQQALVRAGGDPRDVDAISGCREMAQTIEKVQ